MLLATLVFLSLSYGLSQVPAWMTWFAVGLELDGGRGPQGKRLTADFELVVLLSLVFCLGVAARVQHPRGLTPF